MNARTGLTKLPHVERTPLIRHPTTGDILTAVDLPAAGGRWTPMRKTLVVLAVRNGLLSVEDALKRYSFTLGEFKQFGDLYDNYGPSGLRTTRSQKYPVAVSHVPQSVELEPLGVVSVGDITITRKTRSVDVGGCKVHCPGKEFEALEFLMDNAGSIVTKDMVMKHLYDGRGRRRPDHKILDVFIYKLRKKLRKEDGPHCIETIWGRGYRFMKPPIDFPAS